MSDSQNWRREKPSLKEMNGLNVPVGDKIHHHVAEGAQDIIEIVPGVSGVVVVEIEVGTFRCRIGALAQRQFTAVAVTNRLTVTTVLPSPYRDNDGPLRLSTFGVLPTGLAIDTDYWVRDVEGDSFKLSLRSGGSVVEFTDNGTPVNNIGGNNGDGQEVGFAPADPPIVDTDDVGSKKMRVNELQVFDAPVTFSPSAADDVLTYWEA